MLTTFRLSAKKQEPHSFGTSGVGFEAASSYEGVRFAKTIFFFPCCGSLIIPFAVS